MKLVRTIIILVAVAITMLFTWQANAPVFAKSIAPACRGTNLLDRLQATDSAAYAALRKREAATPNGQGLLWKIEREDLAASYLYGTMHISDERLTTLPGPVADALDQAKTVALELDEIADDKKMQQEIVKNIGLITFANGRTLDKVLSKNELLHLKTVLRKMNMPYAASRIMKPWFVMLSLALPACEKARQKAGLKAVDAIIAQTAQKNGARLVGLETVREQFSAFDSMSLDNQRRFLMNSLRMIDLLDDQIETMAQLYLQRRTAGLWEFAVYLTKKSARDHGRSPKQMHAELDALKKFERELVIKRNNVMRARALPWLASGNLFMAVGALHLPGKHGLVALLREAGYKVSVVY